MDALLQWLNTPAPSIGDAGSGMVIVGAEDPLLYTVKVIAIAVLLVAVLIIVCDPQPSSEPQERPPLGKGF